MVGFLFLWKYGYLDWVNETVAACLDEAAANLRRARIFYATTDTELRAMATLASIGFSSGPPKA